MAESCSQVDSDPAIQSSTPNRNGKRGAEEVVDPQAVGYKKHKTVEKMNSEMEESIKEEDTVEVALAIDSQDEERASISNEEVNDDCSKEKHQHLESPNRSVHSDPADATQSTTSIKNAKRGVEEVVEPQVVGNKKQKVIEEMNSGTEERIKEEDKVEVPLAIKSQDDAEKASISNEEDNDDCSKEENQHLESPKRSDLKLDNELHITGSKRLHLGNLSFLIEEDDVRDFFKNVGEIAELRFAIKNDKFLGYGHIEFATAEAAQEALKLDQKVLLDRPVKLNFARQQQGGAYTPRSSMDKSYKRGLDVEAKTVYVRGFKSSDGFDNIKSALAKHFGNCGEMSRLHVPKHHVSGDPRGVAFIEFTERKAFNEALGLDGSEIGGCRLTVEVAKKLRNDGREGSSGYGGGGWSGSGGGWVRESGSASDRGKQTISDHGWSGSGRGGWSGSDGGSWSGSGGVRDSGSASGRGKQTISDHGWSGSGRGGWSGSDGGSWSGSGGGWVGEIGSASGRGKQNISGHGWSGSGRGGWSGSDAGSWSGSGGVRESGSASGRGRQNVSGHGWSGSGRGGWSRSGSGWVGESGSASGRGGKNVSGGSWARESGWRRDSGSGGSWHREGGSGGGWHRGRGGGYGSSSHTVSGSSNSWQRESGSWHRESGYGRGGFGRGGSRSSNSGFMLR